MKASIPKATFTQGALVVDMTVVSNKVPVYYSPAVVWLRRQTILFRAQSRDLMLVRLDLRSTSHWRYRGHNLSRGCVASKADLFCFALRVVILCWSGLICA